MLCVNIVLHVTAFYYIRLKYRESALNADSTYVSRLRIAAVSFPGKSDRKCSLRDVG